MEIKKFNSQYEEVDVNISRTTPIHLYRVSWKKESNKFFDFWTSSFDEALEKKYEIDHNESLSYLNFESWYGYPSSVHDQLFGKVEAHRWDNNQNTIDVHKSW